MEFAGSAAVVTGGSSGIGAAVVSQLRARRTRVAVLDVAPATAEDPDGIVCDVSREEEVAGSVAAAASRLGGLDLAVLSAGIGGMSPLLDMSTAEWDRVMAVNLRGCFLSLREVARRMSEAGRGGSIVVVTSISGFLADRSTAHYNTSKAGAAALVRVAARELGPRGIRVNAVAPGTTDTPMLRATDRLPGYREKVAARASLGRLGSPEEVAAAILAVAGLEWVTGQVLAVDGGLSLFSPIDAVETIESLKAGGDHR